MSHLPNTGRRHSARFTSLPEEGEAGGDFEDEPLNDPTPPHQPPRPSLTQQQQRYSDGTQQEHRYSDVSAVSAYEQQEYSLNTPYDSPPVPRDRRFSHSAAHLQQLRYEDNPASAPAAAGGLGVLSQQDVQYDYFATTRSRGYSHARTISGSSATGMMTPSPYEYPHNSNSPTDHGAGQGGSRAPIYDKPLPNYKPTALRRPFLLVLLVVIAGIIGGLVVGLLQLPVSQGGLVARALHGVEARAGNDRVVTPGIPDVNNLVVQTTPGAVGDFESLNGATTVSVGNGGAATNNQPQAPTVVLDGGIDPTITGVPPSDNFGNLNPLSGPSATGAPNSNDFGNLNNPPAVTTRPAVTGDDFGNLNEAISAPTTGTGVVPPGAFGNLHNNDGTAPAVVLDNTNPTHTPLAPGNPPPQAFGGLSNEETVLVGNEDQEPTHTHPNGVTGNPPPTSFVQLNDNEPSGTLTGSDGDTPPATSAPVDPGSPPSHTTQQVHSSDFEDPFAGHSTTVPYVQSSDFEDLDGMTTTVGYVPSSEFGNLEPEPTPTDDNHPTTLSAVPQSNFGVLAPTDTSHPSATGPRPAITYGAASVVVLTNPAGSPTSTSTIAPQVILTPQTTVMTNSQGQLTTITTNGPIPPLTHILTNAAGTPTKTIVDYPLLPTTTNTKAPEAGSPNGNSFVVISSTTTVASYILGMFVPTIVAILLSIPIRILDMNARVFHPWHQLSRPRGSLGRHSICLEPFGWHGYLEVFRVLGSGQWLLLATTILTILSAVLIPLSAETIRIKLQGTNCRPGTMTNKGCQFITTAFTTPTYVCIGILGVMALILIGLIFTMGRWKTGVACNPWSIGSIASLTLNEEVRRLFAALPMGIDASDKAPEHVLESALQDRRFRLGYFYGKESGRIEYGIVLADRDRESINEKHAVSGHREAVDEHYNDYLIHKFDSQPHFKYNQHHQEPIQEMDSKRHLPFLMLGYWGRGLLLFLLLGMITLIGYYTATSTKTEFEKFISGEGSGVRFLFAGMGVVIVFAWASFFESVAIISPFRMQAHRSRPAQKSILLAPPRNGFSGLWTGLRRGDLLLCLTSFIAILTEFLPILLCNTPFRSTQLFIVNRGCTYGSLGILGAMSLVLIASFAVKWPHLPLDPSTVSGMMYYVADSWMLSGFEGGVGKLSRKERDMRIKGLRRSYGFGKGIGVSGRTRVLVDWADESREPVYL